MATATDGNRTLKDVIEDNFGLSLTIAFSVLMIIAAVIINILGFPTVAGMVVAWGIIMLLTTFFFLLVPIYILGFLDHIASRK